MPLDITAPAHRFMEQYAKQYNAGAFATPTRKEIEADPGRINDRTTEAGRIVIARTRVERKGARRVDFTGTAYDLPVGASVATHVARSPGALCSFMAYDYVMAYAEDRELSDHLRAEGREITASRITAAAEIINVWGPNGTGRRYADHDLATVTRVPIDIFDLGLQERLTAEVGRVKGWDDDFPYYSDGSWSAVCLKGFWPDEPGRGVKPSEMPKSWKAEHVADLGRTAQWTVLTEQLPALTKLVRGLPYFGKMERVRLLRMTAGGALGRHTDITDRFGGTRDGQITRFHIPLITTPETKLITWDLDGVRREQHLEAWGCYYLDARKPHAVVNGPADRVHLVIDAVTNDSVRELIRLAYGFERDEATRAAR